MANIHETIEEVEKLNPDLARQIKKYVKDHSYGLVFENNLPEAVRLYKKVPNVGDTVNILPDRGKEEKADNKVAWIVREIKDGTAIVERDENQKKVAIDDLVTLVSYRDVIYPGLKEIDRIERGGADDPYHVVINAENYHALEMLTYCYAGKVDCIYIDPPYNSGAKDWKYNNDYVATDDQYRHSKWLAFMERRLKLARQLLNPEESVLIVAIDEKEYLRLGLLLEQVFPGKDIQMVTVVMNAKGAVREGKFSRVEEYLFIVSIGNAKVHPLQYNMLDTTSADVTDEPKDVEWLGFRRREGTSVRSARPNQFYPIFVDNKTGRIVEIGDRIDYDVPRESVVVPEGCTALWPLKPDGTEMLWGLTPDAARRNLSKGYLRVNNWKPKTKKGTVQYLQGGVIEGIEKGDVIITGRKEDGSIIAQYQIGADKISPKRVWNVPAHNAENYGTDLVSDILGKGKFNFPKSLYAVKDILNFYLKENKNALVIDFFAGSGTTLHAVNLLNTEDNGHRRCICVTNNEVSADEQARFIENKKRQGDSDWEKYGIANYVTWPRTKCSIEGIDISGKPLNGEYIGSDIAMSDGFKANAMFCELTYESAWPIRLDAAFDAIAPILWMLAGCRGPIIRRIGKSYLMTDYYGVLFDYNQASKFCEKIKSTPTIKTAFVVTDDQRRYSNICKRLPNVDIHRLYETFLRTFEICGEGGLD